MDTSLSSFLSMAGLPFAGSSLQQLSNSTQVWLLVAPLAALQLGLMIFALVDWARRSRTRYLDRWVWLAIIVLFGLLGPIAYFFLGREDE